MKKYLLGIAAMIIAITFSAFTMDPKGKAGDPEFHWFLEGEYTGFEDTVIGREGATDCDGENEPCEYGYNDPEDFVDGNPLNGLAKGAEHDAVIYLAD